MTPIQKRAVGLVLVVAAYAGAWAAMAERARTVALPTARAAAAVPVQMPAAAPAHERTLHCGRTDHEFRVADDPSFVIEAVEGCEWSFLLGEIGSVRVGTMWVHGDWAIAQVSVKCFGQPAVEIVVCLNRYEGKKWSIAQVRRALPSERAVPDTT